MPIETITTEWENWFNTEFNRIKNNDRMHIPYYSIERRVIDQLIYIIEVLNENRVITRIKK